MTTASPSSQCRDHSPANCENCSSRMCSPVLPPTQLEGAEGNRYKPPPHPEPDSTTATTLTSMPAPTDPPLTARKASRARTTGAKQPRRCQSRSSPIVVTIGRRIWRIHSTTWLGKPPAVTCPSRENARHQQDDDHKRSNHCPADKATCQSDYEPTDGRHGGHRQGHCSPLFDSPNSR